MHVSSITQPLTALFKMAFCLTSLKSQGQRAARRNLEIVSANNAVKKKYGASILCVDNKNKSM